MEAKFTPGPWEAIQCDDLPDNIVSATGVHVADVFHTDLECDSENVYLIAAAPDLYAALTELSKHAEAHDDCGSESGTWKSKALTAMLVRAGLALKKARGE